MSTGAGPSISPTQTLTLNSDVKVAEGPQNQVERISCMVQVVQEGTSQTKELIIDGLLAKITHRLACQLAMQEKSDRVLRSSVKKRKL